MTGVFAVDFARFFVVLGGFLVAKKAKKSRISGLFACFWAVLYDCDTDYK